MSDKLMDTEPGGEQTQYEGAHTFVQPHAKQAGRLGGMLAFSKVSIIHTPCLVHGSPLNSLVRY